MPAWASASAFKRLILSNGSSNGTYVNKRKVGRGNRVALTHGDEIALTLKPGGPVFVYHDAAQPVEDPRHDPRLRAAYTLVRLLGRGACGEVWLAVSKITGQRFAVKIIQKRRFMSFTVQCFLFFVW